MADFVEPMSFVTRAGRGYSPVPVAPRRRTAQTGRRDLVAARTRWTKRRPKAASRWPTNAPAHTKTSWCKPGSEWPAACTRRCGPSIRRRRRTACESRLGCSSWAAAMELDDETRDVLEVAALLHDVGKIGVPDKVLLKPGRLPPEEIALMSRHAARTIEILASCGVPQAAHRNRPLQPRLVQQQRPTAGSPGRRAAAGVADVVDRRCVRLDDHRPRLSPGPLARAGAGRAVRIRRQPVRSGAGAAVRGAVLAGSEPADGKAGPPLAASLAAGRRRRCRGTARPNTSASTRPPIRRRRCSKRN